MGLPISVYPGTYVPGAETALHAAVDTINSTWEMANVKTTELEAKVAQQLKSQRVGYLLGAGSSYLNGNGYPLAFQLWDLIKGSITDVEKRDDIQAKLDGGANGIEHALDLLDDGGATDTPYRHLVTATLAELFMSKVPPLELHGEFVRRIARHADPSVKAPVNRTGADQLTRWIA